MSGQANLVVTVEPTPKPRTKRTRVLLTAPDAVPIAWMALYQPADIRDVQGAKPPELTASTRVADAITNLRARIPALVALRADAGAHLAAFCKLLESCDPEHHVRIDTKELATRWLPGARELVQLLTTALDTGESLLMGKLEIAEVAVGTPVVPPEDWPTEPGALPPELATLERAAAAPPTSQTYDDTQRYASGDRIVHPGHGAGIVVWVRDGNVIEALFERGSVTLRHGSEPGTSVGDYAAGQRYAVGDSLVHPSFGLGTVTAVQPNVMTVRFASGVKTLGHDRQPPSADAMAKPGRIDHSLPTPGARRKP